jgi:transcriptional regulator with PAS, ATPase and Fis domain
MIYCGRFKGVTALGNGLTYEDAMEFINGLVMAVLNKAGVYTFVSDGWERYTGLAAEDVIGKRVWDVIPETKAGEVFRTGKPVLGHPVTCRGVPAFTSYFPRLGPDGSVEGVFLYVIINGMHNAQAVISQINTLTSELEFYKRELSRERGARYDLDSIIGRSEAILQMKEQIAQAARSSSTVLIEGETGSGKELIAHAIHAMSPRRTANFVRVNCSAIPPELMESEFFGYTAGAFTGASRKGKVGRFQLANGGSIFLDEVNLLTSTMQPKFLRVLQEMEIDPVGGDQSVQVDVRVIAASNVPLERQVEEGLFRSDLYFRLNVIRIMAPPLRSRKEDIPFLVDNFIQKLNFQLGMVIEGVHPEMMGILQSYDWPGNVRELQNALESAMNMADSPVLEKKDFGQLIKRIHARSRRALRGVTDYRLKSAKWVFERELVQDALDATGGSRVRAAELLGISRNVLYQKLEKYKLK